MNWKTACLPVHRSAFRLPRLLLWCRFVFVEVGGACAVELGGREAYDERLGRVGEGRGAAALALDFGDERVLPAAEAHDVAALVEDDEEECLALARAHLADQRARAAVGARERPGLGDDAAAAGACGVALLQGAGVYARDGQDVCGLQVVVVQGV